MWTESQQKVINSENKNLLVSASAGSGKTAVLVERIIKKVMDKNIDIDRLLVLTFTKAAASEMKERIGKAIEEALKNNQDNEHLQKQQTLVHNAQITTIDSFCLNVVKNNFSVINLDPAFRIADESELSLMKADVIEEMLEEHYEKKEDDFCNFVESYSTGKNDAVLEELILELYKFSQGYQEPERWLEDIKKIFQISSMENFENAQQGKFITDYIKNIFTQVYDNISEAIDIAEEVDGPYMYLDALRSDEEFVKNVSEADGYRKLSEVFEKIKWARLSSKKDETVDPDKKEKVKELRDEAKKILNDKLKKEFFFKSGEEIIEDIVLSGKTLCVLIDLVLEFSRRYEEKKLAKNILDFSDLEHKALEILTKKAEDGKFVPSDIANSLREYYKEVMIDEYQDINLVQEELLKSVSNDDNRFMVGDVKQSIYKFRLARPEIFTQKQKEYSQNTEKNENISLNKNFRSRKEVLNFVNFIFAQIMEKSLGEIDYDEEASLKNGAEFSEISGLSNIPEILLAETNPDGIEDEDEQEYTEKELEAKMVAGRIKELIESKHMILEKRKTYSDKEEFEKDIEEDKSKYSSDENDEFCFCNEMETGIKYIYKYDCKENCKYIYRNVRYGDIVILLRAMTGWSEVFEEVLTGEGIAAHCETSTGYFGTLEISVIISMLKIIDNPRQDIPLCAVLKSPVVGLTSEELAIIKSKFKELNMYEAVNNYMYDENADEGLKSKLEKFKSDLEDFRECVHYMSVHEIIQRILDKTGYGDYVLAMPAGKKRRANIDMLIQKAIEYEKSSYKGLFNFIRYIDKMREYEIDFGEANLIGENENAVKIMSIHKSKGLEFPIVFVSGIAKGFNKMDTVKKVVIHSELGLGCDYIDHELRIKSPTILKKVISKKILLESLGEELRVLYVAMTRAKELLILTGAVDDLNGKISDYFKKLHGKKKSKLSFWQLSYAGSYLDWIMPALIQHKNFSENCENFTIKELVEDDAELEYENEVEFKVKSVKFGKSVDDELEKQLINEFEKRELLELIEQEKKEIFEEVDKKLSWSYKYSKEINLPTKLTVTELKKRSQNLETEEEYEEVSVLPKIEDLDEIVPRFIHEEKELSAAQKGTATHKLMQYLEFDKVISDKELEELIETLKNSNRLTVQEAEAVEKNKVLKFMESDLAKRMIEAKQNNKLFKEKQFLMSVRASEIQAEYSDNETILVQGVIDVFFEENGEMVLVDYKTDRVKKASLLEQRYSAQLEYYKKALEKIKGKKVKEKIIYSFELDKEIRLD